jgi:Fe-S cluster assembly protein SufD
MSSVAVNKIRDIVGRLPTPRDEDWKYTDLARARDISSRWLDAGGETPATSLDAQIATITDSIDATWFVIANGSLTNLGSAAGVAAEKIDRSASEDDALAELNAALPGDGLSIAVEGVLEKPIGLLVIDGCENASLSQAFIDIKLAPNAECEIIEYHASTGDEDQYANTVVVLTVAGNAEARHVRIQDRDLAHIQTGRTTVSLARDARFRSASFDLGGGLIRNDLLIDIAEPGADASFDGLYLAGEGQHIDNHTRIDHRVGPATSRQEYRGILNGKCRCVWNGKAIVHGGADGTDANQANHNLLLSPKAEIDAKPELEIYTDEVKCSHGTTVGQLDEASLFYLRSRGLDKQRATEILTHAFAAGLVSRVPVAAAKDTIATVMERRLAALIQSDEDFGL